MAETTEKKVVTLDNLATFAGKIKADYATNESVDEKVQNAGSGALTYATDEEVLALFNDTAEDAGETA